MNSTLNLLTVTLAGGLLAAAALAQNSAPEIKFDSPFGENIHQTSGTHRSGRQGSMMDRTMSDRFQWVRLLAFVTGLVNEELLLRNEYLVAENRVLRAHLPSRLR